MGKAFVLGQRQWIPTAWNVHSNASRPPSTRHSSSCGDQRQHSREDIDRRKCCRHSIDVDDCQIGTGCLTNDVIDPVVLNASHPTINWHQAA